jgi:hypothetical protein
MREAAAAAALRAAAVLMNRQLAARVGQVVAAKVVIVAMQFLQRQ